MKPADWEEILRLHQAALERPESERVAFVLGATPEVEIQREVLRLLSVAESSKPFLEPPPLAVPSAGRDLGDFTLLEEIGRGGMGVVYRALQRSLGRIVAVKVLPAGFALSARQIDRFVREARSAARLSHPNLVGVITVGEEQGIRYFAMEYVDGDNLSEELRRLRTDEPAVGDRSHLPSSRASDYFRTVAEAIRQVAEGLHHAHQHGIVHRDVKPSNLLLDSAGRVRIVDFGLVRDEQQGSLSTTGDLVGTPHYMSPEQARALRHGVDHRTDIYSLGVVLYELLTLRRPFEGKTSQEVITNLLECEAPSIRRLNARVPRDLETICLKAMSREPVSRYQSADQLAADLGRFLSHEAILAKPPSALERLVRRVHRHRISLGLTAVVFLAAIVGAALAHGALKHATREQRLEAIEHLLAEGPLAELPPGRQVELRSLQLLARADGIQSVERGDLLAELERDFQRLRTELVERGRSDLAFSRDLRNSEGSREDRRLSGLMTLTRAAQLFPEDGELARLSGFESALPTLAVSARTPSGEETPAQVHVRELDPFTGAVGERHELGITPLDATPLLPGQYRVVVEFQEGGFRELIAHPGPANMTIELVAVRRSDEERIGADMVSFESASFTYSDYPGEPCFQGLELALPAFQLDRTEVSNADYARFLEATGHPAPDYWALEPDRGAFLAAAGALPVVGVTWPDAVAFANWVGKRLPTLAEWHRAAAGLEGRIVPYSGDPAAPLRGNVLVKDDVLRNTFALEWSAYKSFAVEVDSLLDTASPEGVLHLFGNVDELTESAAVTRGAAGKLELRRTDRFVIGGWWEAATLERAMLMPGYVGLGPNYATWHTGFRCARSREP